MRGRIFVMPMLRALRRAAPRFSTALSAEARCRSISNALVLSFDTETTGVDVLDSRVVELGAVYFRDGARVGPRRGMLVHPGCAIPSGASEVHGIGDTDVASAPGFGEVGTKFMQHLLRGPDAEMPEQPVLLGYNAVSYDVPLLNAEFSRHDIAHQIDADRVLDPFIFLSWHRRSWPKRSLGASAAFFGFDLAERAHSACDDAEATAAVLFGCVETSVIPENLEDALLEQNVIKAKIDLERDAFKHFLYVDRGRWPDAEPDADAFDCAAISADALMFGFGKHAGTPLLAMDANYLGWCLNKVDLNHNARTAIQSAVAEAGNSRAT